MTQEEILLTLKRIVANLQLIHDSATLEEIAVLTPQLMANAADALHHCTQFRLRFSQALDKHLEAELDGIFKEAA